jgi:hypothetical protein
MTDPRDFDRREWEQLTLFDLLEEQSEDKSNG